MKMEFRGGLLFTSVTISFRGETKTIENIVVDTGASETIISPDAVDEIGISAELNDSVNYFYGVGGSLHTIFSKNVDELLIEKVSLKEAKLDFGVIDPKGDINGLLGLDILMKLGAVIDLKDLSMQI